MSVGHQYGPLSTNSFAKLLSDHNRRGKIGGFFFQVTLAWHAKNYSPHEAFNIIIHSSASHFGIVYALSMRAHVTQALVMQTRTMHDNVVHSMSQVYILAPRRFDILHF